MSNSSDNDSALALRINTYSHLSHILNPSSQTGPEPMQIPVTGHSLVAEMFGLGKIDLKIVGFKAEVLRQTSFQSDGTLIQVSPQSNGISLLPPEEAAALQKAREAFTPLEIPHFEILLDKRPPIVRPALKADGQPARPTPPLPFTLHHREYRSFFLAPVTHSPDLTVWSLYAIWEIEGKRVESPYGTFQVTGYTGWWIYSQDGRRPAPVGQSAIADGHWDSQYNPTSST